MLISPQNVYANPALMAELERQAFINSMLYGFGVNQLQGQSYGEFVANNDNLKAIKLNDYYTQQEWERIQATRVDKKTGLPATTFEVGKDYLYYVPPQGLMEKMELLQSKIRYDTEANAFMKYDREVYRGNFINSNGRIQYADHVFQYDKVFVPSSIDSAENVCRIQDNYNIKVIKVLNTNILSDMYYQDIKEVSKNNFIHQEENRFIDNYYSYTLNGKVVNMKLNLRTIAFEYGTWRVPNIFGIPIANNNNIILACDDNRFYNGRGQYGPNSINLFNQYWFAIDNTLSPSTLSPLRLYFMVLENKINKKLYLYYTYDEGYFIKDFGNQLTPLPSTAVDDKDNELKISLDKAYLQLLLMKINGIDKTKVVPVAVSTTMPKSKDDDKIGTIVFPANPADVISEAGAKEGTDVGTGTVPFNPDIPDLDLPSIISTKFPFCIPYDLYRAFAGLQSPPKAPKWTMKWLSYSFVIDMATFDKGILVVRWAFYFIFVIGLIKVTRSLIKG